MWFKERLAGGGGSAGAVGEGSGAMAAAGACESGRAELSVSQPDFIGPQPPPPCPPTAAIRQQQLKKKKDGPLSKSTDQMTQAGQHDFDAQLLNDPLLRKPFEVLSCLPYGVAVSKKRKRARGRR